jgi:hypothetical protein
VVENVTIRTGISVAFETFGWFLDKAATKENRCPAENIY